MRNILLFISVTIFVFIGGIIFYGDTKTEVSGEVARRGITVVLDAGHGGIDVGAVGVNGTLESDLNLKYCQMLGKVMTEYGINVIMTRKTKDGLYSEYKNGFKKEDMQKRREIIINSNPQAVVSIHMNKYSASSSRGAQVFYDDEKKTGEQLAKVLQGIFKKQLVFARSEPQSADLYVLKCIEKPSILVECGFLSNADEEKLLNMLEYQKKVCLCITSAILAVIE